MAIKSMGIIRLHDNMNLNEINQVRVKISDLKGNEKITHLFADQLPTNSTYNDLYMRRKPSPKGENLLDYKTSVFVGSVSPDP